MSGTLAFPPRGSWREAEARPTPAARGGRVGQNGLQTSGAGPGRGRGWGPGLGEAGGRLRAGDGGALGGPWAGILRREGLRMPVGAGGWREAAASGGVRGAVWSPLGEGVW